MHNRPEQHLHACIPAHANEADRRCRALTGSTAGGSQQPASAELQFNSLHVNAALYALQEGGCLKPAIACVVMHGRAFGRDVWPVYVKALGPDFSPPVPLQMLQWKKSRGRQFVFFQSHPGFAFGNENVTKEFYDNIMCKSVGDALHMVVERGQRWKCPTYREGTKTHPHSLLCHRMLPRIPQRTVITCALKMQCAWCAAQSELQG